jgi:hypothetical protein
MAILRDFPEKKKKKPLKIEILAPGIAAGWYDMIKQCHRVCIAQA